MSCGTSSCRAMFSKSVAGGTYPNVPGASVERPYPAIDFKSTVATDSASAMPGTQTPMPKDYSQEWNIGVNNAGDLLSVLTTVVEDLI